MPHIFVSYAHSDEDFVQRLTADLQRAGATVWYDVVGIRPGQEWASAIRDALIDASVVLFISSSASNASVWVGREVNLAIERNIPIIPLIVDDIPSAFHLRTLRLIDFRSDYQTAFNHLLSSLPTILRGQQPLIPEKPKSKGYVFISYAEEDAAFAQSLREFLKARGYGYWDFQESDRDYHKQFSLELEEIIKGAAATLALLSPDWKKSKWAPREYYFSEEVDVPVFLLRVRETEPTLAVAGVPYIDFAVDVEQGFTRLDSELKRKGLI